MNAVVWSDVAPVHEPESGRSTPGPAAAHDDAGAEAWEVVARVTDPEMPMLTLADLGVVRSVRTDGAAVTVTLTPTYSGCPAVEAMREDLDAAAHRRRLRAGGRAGRVQSTVELRPDHRRGPPQARRGGRRAAAPDRAPAHGPVPLTLEAPSSSVRCPHCGAAGTEEISRFGPTACTALHRCRSCREPFEHMKEI